MNKNSKLSSSSVMFGLIIVFIGITVLLENLDVRIAGRDAWVFWPVAVMVIGTFQLFSKSTLFGGLITLVLGILFQLSTLDMLPNDFWKFAWPAILIAFGVRLIFSRDGFDKSNTSDLNTVSGMAFLGGANLKNNSQDFQGGEITAWMGGAVLNLKDADIKTSATVKATAIMGGVEIHVPTNWKININGLPIMGGWDDKTKQITTDDSKTLNINATAVMGGIDIKN